MNTILIVDDMKINIDMLTEILEDKYTIMAAVSGEKAIEAMKYKSPDLVLLDLFMPGIDGFGVLKYMKNRKELSNIPVIFVTGEHDEDTEEKGLSLGAVDYIKRPYNAAVVSVKVRNHIELKTYRDNLEQLIQKHTRKLDKRTKQLEERTRQLEERTEQLAASREAIIMGMSLMSESHDKVTGEHIQRIKLFTRILANKMMEMYPELITEDLVNDMVLFSPLHDIGKIGISDTILQKTGVLTPEEFETMKMHTLDGAELLRKTELFLADKINNNLNVAIQIAECHHEKFDGTGYPRGLKGEEIPISARIVAVVDVYDALRSPRPYKRAFTQEEAVETILTGDGRTSPEHFDPRVLEAFKAVNGEFDKVYE